MLVAWTLLLATLLLVLTGVLLYATLSPGWAQLLWVLASGTAGAGVMTVIERWRDED